MPDVAITPEARAWDAEWHEQVTRRLRRRRIWRIDASILAVAAVLLRLPMLFADRALVFDDGVFGASALAMRAGGEPFRDVFSSQGPLFLPLLHVADLLGFQTADAPRLLAVAAGVVLTVAVYACGRRLTTRGGALLAAGLVTTSGSVLWVTGPINADGPALALVGRRGRGRTALPGRSSPARRGARRPRGRCRAVDQVPGRAGGVDRRRGRARRRIAASRDALTAAAVAVGVYLVTALPWGLGRVWEQSYTYHADARRQGSVGDAMVKVLRTLWERDLAVVVALALAGIVALLVRLAAVRRAPFATPHRLAPEAIGAAVWALLVVAVLLYEPALWRAHVAHLVVPLALLAALRPPPWRVLLVAALVVVPVSVATRGDLWWPRGYDSHEAALIRYLQTSQPDAEFISDDPGLVWRAGRSIPPSLVDPSFQRIDNGDITTESVAGVVGASLYPRVCGVIVTSPRHFGRLEGLEQALEATWTVPGPLPPSPPTRWMSVRHFGPHITVYVTVPPTAVRVGDGAVRRCGARPG